MPLPQTCVERPWDFWGDNQDWIAYTSNSGSKVKTTDICLRTDQASLTFNVRGGYWHYIVIYVVVDGRGPASCRFNNVDDTGVWGSTDPRRTCVYSLPLTRGVHNVEWYYQGDLRDDGRDILGPSRVTSQSIAL